MSKTFNEYFTSIAKSLKSGIKSGNSIGSNTYLSQQTINSIFINNVTDYEINTIISNFKNKATLDTKITALKIAQNIPSFLNTLAEVINASFEQGICPHALKLAKVVAIHKSGSKTDKTNYRPISLLCTFSKIYEKCMHNRVMDFLVSNGTLFEGQYGFRPKRSCEQALLNAQNVLLDSLNRKQVSLLLLIDFSKAFDMVDHNILLDKLFHYGIRGNVHSWFESYLKNRTQYVCTNGRDSNPMPLEYGVPQGSILGPLLFIIYINDLPNISNFAHFILYADDANKIVTGSTVQEVKDKISALIDRLTEWVDCNGLLLNLKKTHYMIFSRSRSIPDIDINIKNVKIKRETESKFLGVIADDGLTWKSHIAAMKTKMSRYFGIMYKLRSQLPQKAKLLIYHSFIQSHLNYCSLVWGFASRSNIDTLFSKLQCGVRAIMPGRVVYKYKDGEIPTHTKHSFGSFNILTIHGLVVKMHFS